MRLSALATLALAIGLLTMVPTMGSSLEEELDLTRRVDQWVPLTEGNFSFFINSSNDMLIQFEDDTDELVPSAPYDPYNDLNTTLQRAVDRAPQWLNDTLVWSFLNIRDMYRMKFASLLLDESIDSRYLDEIAFTIAYTPKDFVDYYQIEGKFIWENVHMMYTVSDDVRYATISDYNLSDGQHSTITYRTPTGNITMPEEIYYWYVLMPRSGSDNMEYMNPETGNFNFSYEGGQHWRSWLYYNNDTGYPLLKEYLIKEDYLWNGTQNQVENNGAVGAVTKWEMESVVFGMPQIRKPNPIYVYKNHLGMCGENAYILAGVAKIALIPTVQTLTWEGNHAWNDFWESGWHQWEAYSGLIDSPMAGGNVFTSFNPDFSHFSLAGQYTTTGNITIRVFDSLEQPIDGVMVKLHSMPAQDINGSLGLIANLTDVNGETTFEVGAGFSYYVTYRAPIGGPPDQTASAVQATPLVVPGINFEFNISIPDTMPLKVNYSKIHKRESGLRFNISAKDIDHLTRYYNDDRNWGVKIWRGFEDIDRLTLLFIDDENLSLYDQGKMFFPGGILNISEDMDGSVILEDRKWNILISGMSAPLTRTFASINVTVSRSIVIPDAIVLSPENGALFRIGEDIPFEGDLDPMQGSYDDYTYRWVDTSDSSQISTERAFSSSFPVGDYEFMFEVRDGLDLIDSTLVDFKVYQPNRPPVALISSPEDGMIFEYGTVISFSGFGSFDIDDEMISYDWIEVGINETISDERNFSMKFDPGSHTIELNVSDGRGLSSWDMVYFTVKRPNLPPDPYIRSPQPWSIFEEGNLVELNATGTHDPEGDVLEYTWISSRDGVISKMMKDKVVLSIGEHDIQLWVNDGEFNISTSVHISIWMVEEPHDWSPVAVIDSPSGLVQYFVSDEIEFSASGSYDPDGEDLTYMWFLDGELLSSEETFRAKLGKGIHHVQVMVTSGMLTDNATVMVLVSDRIPVLEIYVNGMESTMEDHINVTAYENLSFDCSRSKDPDGDDLTYNWSLDGNMMSDEAMWVYSFEPGSFLVQLTVEDGGGNRMSTVFQINSRDDSVVPVDDEPVDEVDERKNNGVDPILLIIPIVLIAICIALIVVLGRQTRKFEDDPGKDYYEE